MYLFSKTFLLANVSNNAQQKIILEETLFANGSLNLQNWQTLVYRKKRSNRHCEKVFVSKCPPVVKQDYGVKWIDVHEKIVIGKKFKSHEPSKKSKLQELNLKDIKPPIIVIL